MRSILPLISVGVLLACASPATSQWSDNFDSYANNTVLSGGGVGVGGWAGWDLTPAAAGTASNAFARSAPNSILIGAAADAVRPGLGATSGRWVLSAWQYIETGKLTANTWVIINNRYTHNGPKSWSCQFRANSATKMIEDRQAASRTTTPQPVVFDKWVEWRLEIDLDANTIAAYYNGQLLSQGTYVTSTTAAVAIENIDLFSQGSTCYFDDISLTSQLVSPATHVSTEGNSNNTFPFYGNTFHYQQVQGDLRGKVQIVKQIAFRRDGTTSTSSAAKTVTAALWMGHGDYATVGTTYANNYDTAGRTQVVPAGPINLPAMPAKPTSPPAAFTAIIPFKTSFIYLGTKDLVWEYVCSASSSTASYVMDAVSSGGAKSGPYTLLGTGCVATGQTSAMVARAYLTTFRSPDRVRYYCYTNYGTKTAAAGILVGLKNPNAPFPICNKILYTNADLVTIAATSSATGYFNSTTGLYFPWNPAFAGLKIYSQTYTADAAMGPIPVAVSNGVESTIPTLGPKPGAYARIYSYNNHTATSGSLGNGYSVVTQFK